MKLILRILNAVIMAISLAATIFLFVSPSFSFNSNVGLDVETFSKFVPQNELTEDVDIVDALGTNEIHLGISFVLNFEGITKTMKGDREIINNDVISKNIDDVLTELREPVQLITDHSVRGAIQKIIQQQITLQVDNARNEYKEKYNQEPPMTTEQIMEDVGMDDYYFHEFAKNLYVAMDKEDATVSSVTDVLFDQIDDALAKAEATGMVDTSSFGEDIKTEVSSNLVTQLSELDLVEEGDKVVRISEISYVYLAKFLKEKLNASDVNQHEGETKPEYADRLLQTYVLEIMPDVFYKGVGYVSLGLVIGLFVFVFLWGFVFVVTLIKTLTSKPWTFFGPWFWILGPLQLVLGLGLTVAGKFLLPKAPLDLLKGLPIKSIVLAPRTYALVPSILFLVMIVLGIVYAVFKGMAKSEDRVIR